MNEYMKIALDEATYGVRKQHGGPFGCVIVKDGKVIAEYESMREAERQTNIAHSSIKKAITGKLKNAGGFQWEYKK